MGQLARIWSPRSRDDRDAALEQLLGSRRDRRRRAAARRAGASERASPARSAACLESSSDSSSACRAAAGSRQTRRSEYAQRLGELERVAQLARQRDARAKALQRRFVAVRVVVSSLPALRRARTRGRGSPVAGSASARSMPACALLEPALDLPETCQAMHSLSARRSDGGDRPLERRPQVVLVLLSRRIHVLEG